MLGLIDCLVLAVLCYLLWLFVSFLFCLLGLVCLQLFNSVGLFYLRCVVWYCAFGLNLVFPFTLIVVLCVLFD